MNWNKATLWLGSIIFFVEENAYFGWNHFPKSDAELIADGILFLLTAIAVGYKP